MLMYVRQCLGTTKSGARCKNANYVNRDGLCPAHRGKQKVAPELISAMIEREIAWEVWYEKFEKMVADRSRNLAQIVQYEDPGMWELWERKWSLKNAPKPPDNPRRAVT